MSFGKVVKKEVSSQSKGLCKDGLPRREGRDGLNSELNVQECDATDAK